jgi:predicted nuclease of predicted toxin-antitoxin system
VIFIDASVPRSVADEIKKVRPDARWIGDLFPLDTKDPVWLREAGRQGWLVITHDKKIRTRPGERRAIIESSAGCFILAYKQDLKKIEVAELVLSVLEDMEQIFDRTERPFIYTVSKSGEFRRYV